MCRSSDEKAPIETVLAPPSWLAQYTCVSILLAIFAVWGKYSFIDEADLPNGTTKQIHSAWVPLCLTSFYLLSLPILKIFSDRFLKHSVDVKILLQPSMVIYNAAQVAINGWMVYRIVEALVSGRHDIIGGPIHKVDSGAIYPVYIHYCDKYLEFLDTYFMVLRGKMDQVSFLHIYHHTSIAIAWWLGLKLYPGGDIYFGALINSWIHVMMYSYYTLSLLKISCPWKKYLTLAQLIQFLSVLVYSGVSMWHMPKDGTWLQYVGHCVQDFEMTSLFVLFMHFYRKAYSSKNSKKTTSSFESEASEATTEQDSISSASSDDR